MTQKFSVLTDEGIETFTVVPGLDQASLELTKFVSYLQGKHPNLSVNESGWIAAYFINNIPQMIEANPNLVEIVEETALYVKNNNADNA
ncbi:MAG: hypothetical protein WBA07_09825 [Rivularia sp. (in: cyanobacteria)]